MKVLCPVKKVIDYQVKIRVNDAGTAVETHNVPHSMNPFDEIAMEEAVRWKEQGRVDEIIAVTIGNNECSDILRKALAHGADKAVLIETATDAMLRPAQVAACLQAVVNMLQPDCILMGKQAIDDDCNQTGQYLAGLLQWPQATFASEITWEDDKRCQVSREVDGGLLTVKLQLPAVITCDLRLNEPRYLSLPNIVKAKQKPLEVMPVNDLNITLNDTIESLSVSAPPVREAGVMLDSVEALMTALCDKEALLS